MRARGWLRGNHSHRRTLANTFFQIKKYGITNIILGKKGSSRKATREKLQAAFLGETFHEIVVNEAGLRLVSKTAHATW